MSRSTTSYSINSYRTTHSMRLLILGIQCISPEFCGDLVYRIRKTKQNKKKQTKQTNKKKQTNKTLGISNLFEQFRKLINRYKRIGYNPDTMRQTAGLIVNPINIDSYDLLFNCAAVVRASDLMTSFS